MKKWACDQLFSGGQSDATRAACAGWRAGLRAFPATQIPDADLVVVAATREKRSLQSGVVVPPQATHLLPVALRAFEWLHASFSYVSMVNPTIARAGAEDVLIPRKSTDPLRVGLGVCARTREAVCIVDSEFARECTDGQC